MQYEQKINTIWNEWKPGELEALRNTTFLAVSFDKPDRSIRIRLFFEEDLLNQQVVNMSYDWLPGNFQIILDAIGKRVESVVAEGTQDHASYLVKFTDGYWFRI